MRKKIHLYLVEAPDQGTCGGCHFEGFVNDNGCSLSHLCSPEKDVDREGTDFIIEADTGDDDTCEEHY